MEVIPLHTVFAKGHIHAVVELGMSHRYQGHEQQKQERVFLFRGHYHSIKPTKIGNFWEYYGKFLAQYDSLSLRG